ncbi:hypothetical protein NMG60_11026316 [Bertholletia excelsa]
MTKSPKEISAPLIQKDGFQVDASICGDENSPIEHVALTVPVTDDPTSPVVTFRMWILGAVACAVLSFLNQFFWYRQEPLSITAISAQIAVVPLGRLMAAALPRHVFFQGKRWEFTLNPGPFGVKEHVLITIFASSGAGSVYAIHIVSAVKVFYRKELTFLVSLIVVLTTQVLGFGWAGMFRRFLVEPAEMWWPQNLVQVSLFRALHDKEERSKGRLTRNQFFLIAFTCSFAYYVFPGYLPNANLPLLDMLLGSGLYGLGVGAVGLDWSSISSYLKSPLASPWFATANVIAGFVLIMYVMTPIAYWLNIYRAKTFPIFSDGLSPPLAYEQQGPLYLSTFFAISYALSFACLAASVVHVLLFHGRDLWQQTKSAFQEKKMDVPEWWFSCILLINIAATIFICEHYKDQLQLPWWAVLLACGLAFFSPFPPSHWSLNVITEYIIGYLYPGYPVANIITFLQDFKLGHYMKIPPRTMFMAQGTILSAVVHLSTAWWLMDTIPDLCDRALLPPGSPWTCPSDHVFYDASVIWGLIGPRRIFGDLGYYSAINWFFLAGAAVPSCWIIIAFFSGFVAYRYYRGWWSRTITCCPEHLMRIGFHGCAEVDLKWWGSDTGPPLASCPTEEGILEGMPHYLRGLMLKAGRHHVLKSDRTGCSTRSNRNWEAF